MFRFKIKHYGLLIISDVSRDEIIKKRVLSRLPSHKATYRNKTGEPASRHLRVYNDIRMLETRPPCEARWKVNENKIKIFHRNLFQFVILKRNFIFEISHLSEGRNRRRIKQFAAEGNVHIFLLLTNFILSVRQTATTKSALNSWRIINN